MVYRVVYEFHKDDAKAKSALKKIPKTFSHPSIYKMKDGTLAVLAGEYNREDWANAAIKKLYESGLWGGLLQEE